LETIGVVRLIISVGESSGSWLFVDDARTGDPYPLSFSITGGLASEQVVDLAIAALSAFNGYSCCLCYNEPPAPLEINAFFEKTSTE